MLLIYCTYINARVEYTFNYILNTICGFDFSITSDVKTYINHKGATINYSHVALKTEDIQIKPNGLLEIEKVISVIATAKRENTHFELLLEGENLKEGFDVFAATFYLITRYEEYFDFAPDAHGNFPPSDSVLFKANLLLHPVINIWASELKRMLLERYPDLKFKQKEFQNIITIDIDQAFAFKHRGLIKNSISFFKNLVTFNLPFLKSQVKTLLFKQKDAFDTFLYLKDVQNRNNRTFLYFFNVGNYSRFDKNLPSTNKAFIELIKYISSYADVGLHPSYYSNENPDFFKIEKEKLTSITGKEITKSRQHFLKLRLPDTYRQLISIGIKEDYSMGYASEPGFRAGTCTPFYWFDLQTNKSTELKVFPITYMEGTLGEDLGLGPNEALHLIKNITDEVKKYNSYHISIWHNHTLNNMFFWKDWRQVFEKSISYLNED